MHTLQRLLQSPVADFRRIYVVLPPSLRRGTAWVFALIFVQGVLEVITYSLFELFGTDSYACNINVLPASGCNRCQADLLSDDQACPDNYSCVKISALWLWRPQ